MWRNREVYTILSFLGVGTQYPLCSLWWVIFLRYFTTEDTEALRATQRKQLIPLFYLKNTGSSIRHFEDDGGAVEDDGVRCCRSGFNREVYTILSFLGVGTQYPLWWVIFLRYFTTEDTEALRATQRKQLIPLFCLKNTGSSIRQFEDDGCGGVGAVLTARFTLFYLFSV